jgi:NtrC-family two-component system sensor histidine kinase KinB
MKLSIRTKFTLGMVFIFFIILVLSVFSALYLNKMSKKTSAIHKENYLSVVYARDMNEGLLNINYEITTSYLLNRQVDNQIIQKELAIADKSLQLEKGNITEAGEDKLVAGIEKGFVEYRDSVEKFTGLVQSADQILYLQKKFGFLSQQLVLLSQMNGNAIELKTDDAKASAKTALTQMTMLAALCFLIALSFTYSFATYFNERFFQLYNGIKEIVSSNYGQRLYFDGTDEFSEISLVFNQMAEKLSATHHEKAVNFLEDSIIEDSFNDMQELKSILVRIKSIEEQAKEVITRLENKT